MRGHQHLTEEVGMLDRLIAVIASEIESERTASDQHDALLREMEDALAELRLARGVRLMLLNAYGERPATEARRSSRAISVHRVIGWPRAGHRVA